LLVVSCELLGKSKTSNQQLATGNFPSQVTPRFRRLILKLDH
jgi:hypothetical protein